jgi:hypothetical protein
MRMSKTSHSSPSSDREERIGAAIEIGRAAMKEERRMAIRLALASCRNRSCALRLAFLLNSLMVIRKAVNRALNARFYCVNLSVMAGLRPNVRVASVE